MAAAEAVLRQRVFVDTVQFLAVVRLMAFAVVVECCVGCEVVVWGG